MKIDMEKIDRHIKWMVENGAEVIKDEVYGEHNGYTPEEVPFRIFSGQMQDIENIEIGDPLCVTQEEWEYLWSKEDVVCAMMIEKAKEE